MKRNIIQQVIIDQANYTLPADYTERDIFHKIKSFINSPDIIILSGLRRVGKSTLLQKLRHSADTQDQGYFINFDDDRLIQFQHQDFQLLYEVFIELFGLQNTFYFDEIQNIHGWERFVRRLHDEGKKVFITGSNAMMLSRELGTHLTGRHIRFELFPFSFSEFIRFKQLGPFNMLRLTTQDKGLLLQAFTQYQKCGGIAEFIKFENYEYLHALYEGIIYRDIITRYKLPQEKPLKELAFYLASHIGKDTSYNALKNMLGLGNASTVSEYCHYLEMSYLCFFLHRYHPSLKKQIYYNKKHYFIDHAFTRTIGFRPSEDKGRMLENIVFLELRRHNKEIYFHRNNYECDFLVRENNKITAAFQVCLSLEDKTTKERELRGLLEAMHNYQLNEGTILTETEEDYIEIEDNKHVHIIPIYKWLMGTA